MPLDDELSQLIAARQYANVLSLHAHSGAKKVSKGYIANGMLLGAGVASSASMSTCGGSTGGSGPESSYSTDSPDCSGSEGHTNSQLTHGNGAPGLTIQKHVTAALANWEACLKNEEVRTRANAEQIRKAHEVLKAAGPLKAAAMEPAQCMPAETPKQFLTPAAASAPAVAAPCAPTAAAANHDASSLNALQKALSEWGFTLPAEAAHAAHQFLQQETQRQRQEAALQQAEKNLKAMQLLKQKLEKEQEETLLKMIGNMQAEQQPVHQNLKSEAIAKQLMSVSAPGCGGNWPQMLGSIHQCPESAALQAAFSGRPVFGPMFGGSCMHPMGIIPHMPYGAQVSLPQAPSSAINHLQPVNNLLGRQQGHNGNALRKPREVKHLATSASGEEETLRKNLRELENVDPDRVILVRKINRLGFESPEVLEEHYSKYGKVNRVLVAHTHVRSENRRFTSRMRPSCLGFVVMSKKEDARAIMALGREQVVNGATILVQSFQRLARAKDVAHLEHERIGAEQA